MIESGSFQGIQRGRHFVAISLFEAESLRAAIHIRDEKPLIEGECLHDILHHW